MATKNHAKPTTSATGSNLEKDPTTWTTGGEPMTDAQKSYLHTLSAEVGVEPDDSLTKGEASMAIDSLRKKDPRVNG